MNRTGVRRWAKTAAILIFVSAVSATAVGRHVPAQRPPLLLTLEFANSAEEVRRLTPPNLRDVVIRAQRLDGLLLIPSYWALFVASGMVMTLSGGTRNRALGLATIAAITVSAALDYGENAAIASAFEGPGLADTSELRPAPWATGKWLLLFLTSALVAAAIGLRPKPRPHAILAAALLGLAGLLGIIAILFARQLVQPAVGAMAAGLLVLALLWILEPSISRA